MTKLLAIKAHPLSGEKSKSIKVFDHFLAQYKAAHPEDEITFVDLYSEDFPEIDLDMMNAWDALKAGTEFTSLSATQQEKITRFNQSTEQFLAADKIVIANSLWNLNVPSRLKSWFDTINVAGKTFTYTEAGPVALTEGKKALHIQSSGGVYNGEDFSAQYVKAILNFVGVQDVQAIYVEGADYSPERAEEIMNGALNQADAIIRTF